MDDLISRTWLLAEYDKRHKGPPGGARKLIEEAPSALGTNLAEVGTDCISRQDALDICDHAIDLFKGQFGAGVLVAIKESIEELPSAQPEIIRCKDCKKNVIEVKKNENRR